MGDEEMEGIDEERYFWTRLGKEAAYILMVSVGALIGSCILWGCATRTVVVPEVHEKYVMQTDTLIRLDSIHVKDSVYVEKVGDTVFYSKWATKYRDRIVYRTKCDTVIVTDSISYPVYIDKDSGQSIAYKLLILAFILLFILLVIFKGIL